MSDLTKFLQKLQQMGCRTYPEEDYLNYFGTLILEIELPDHTKWELRPTTHYEDLAIEVKEERR